MTLEQSVELAPQPKIRPRNYRYQGRALTVEAATRQGEITVLAFELLGGRDAAIAFLNEGDAQLGGRPLDLATSSDTGFGQVASEIRLRAAMSEIGSA